MSGYSNEVITRVSLICAILDIGLVYILYSCVLSWIDYSFVVIILLSHVAFYIALYAQYGTWIDYLHYFMFISLIMSVCLENVYLLGLCLFLLFMIQLLWIFEKKCILIREDGVQFGFSNELSILSIIWTIILSMKIGYKIKPILN